MAEQKYFHQEQEQDQTPFQVINNFLETPTDPSQPPIPLILRPRETDSMPQDSIAFGIRLNEEEIPIVYSQDILPQAGLPPLDLGVTIHRYPPGHYTEEASMNLSFFGIGDTPRWNYSRTHPLAVMMGDGSMQSNTRYQSLMQMRVISEQLTLVARAIQQGRVGRLEISEHLAHFLHLQE